MQITEFKKIGNTNRYKMFVDGDFFAVILDEDIVLNSLKLNKEYSQESLNSIVFNAQNKVALNVGLNLVSKFSKTEKQLKNYLKEKGFAFQAINYAVQKLKEYNYINDEAYAHNYYLTKKNIKGKKAIAYELKNRGVSEETIQNLLNQDLESEEEVIEKIAKKFIKNKPNDPKLKEKLFRHLAGKGFNFEAINKTTKKILSEDNNESWNWFSKY